MNQLNPPRDLTAERAASDRLDEFIRPGVEYRWRLGCLLPRPYKMPRPRLSAQKIDLSHKSKDDSDHG